jgi:hypothetical protein
VSIFCSEQHKTKQHVLLQRPEKSTLVVSEKKVYRFKFENVPYQINNKSMKCDSGIRPVRKTGRKTARPQSAHDTINTELQADRSSLELGLGCCLDSEC